jgi:hypothetical protein
MTTRAPSPARHRCFFVVRNNPKSMHDYPCYIFRCRTCNLTKLVTKKAFWR